MEDIRLNGDPNFAAKALGYIYILRNANHFWQYKSGKEVYSLNYTVSGRMHYKFEGDYEEITVTAGNLCFIPKGIAYSCSYEQDNTVSKMLNFDIVGETPHYLLKPLLVSHSDVAKIYSSISKINMSSMLFLTGKVYDLLNIIALEQRNIPSKYKKILPAIDEINSKFYKNEKVEYYARLCNMSEQNFRRLFKEYMGKSFVEYKNELRLDNVKKMVDSGECTISEAAYFSGFNNMSFYYDCLRKRYKK